MIFAALFNGWHQLWPPIVVCAALGVLAAVLLWPESQDEEPPAPVVPAEPQRPAFEVRGGVAYPIENCNRSHL